MSAASDKPKKRWQFGTKVLFVVTLLSAAALAIYNSSVQELMSGSLLGHFIRALAILLALGAGIGGPIGYRFNGAKGALFGSVIGALVFFVWMALAAYVSGGRGLAEFISGLLVIVTGLALPLVGFGLIFRWKSLTHPRLDLILTVLSLVPLTALVLTLFGFNAMWRMSASGNSRYVALIGVGSMEIVRYDSRAFVNDFDLYYWSETIQLHDVVGEFVIQQQSFVYLRVVSVPICPFVLALLTYPLFDVLKMVFRARRQNSHPTAVASHPEQSEEGGHNAKDCVPPSE